MYNDYELYEHKKSDTLKWVISFLLIAVLLAGMIGAWAVILKDKHEEQPPIEEEQLENDFSMAMKNTEHVMLKMSAMSVLAADNSVSKTITATVLPATATNKAVDWSVEWGSENAATVTDYITVTPTSNGSTTATVTCKQPFTGNIIITATTRENGYQASCIVTFTGLPTDITVNTSVAQSGGFYKVGIGNAYTFDVALTNPFNSVGSQFNNISCEVSGAGSFIVGYMEHYNSSGTDRWTDSLNKTVTLDSLKDSFIIVNYSKGKITVNTLKSIESYYASSERLDSGRTRAYHDKFRSYVDDCYFKITVKENTSGLTKTFNVRFDDSVVTGVSISDAEMSF